MADRIWVIRKIRKGRVKIGGIWYTPMNHWLTYDGRLDGMRYLFARYKNYGEEGDRKWRTFIYCACPADHMGKAPEECPEDPQIVEGYYNWMTWIAEGIQNVNP